MKVTPLNRKFGRYAPGEEFDLPDKVARVFVNAKKLAPVGQAYQTRAMVADHVTVTIVAADSEVSATTRAQIHAASVEVDSAGAEWDATIHASTKLKNSDGTWRKKPGRAAA